MSHAKIRQANTNLYVSIATGPHTMSTPKVKGLPVTDYETVEVAIKEQDKPGVYYLPSQVGLDGFDHLFEDDGYAVIAGYVEQSDLESLLDAFRRLHRDGPEWVKEKGVA